ncbi:hypothetical protein N752_19940 [Desulforamulus aquiferis]|nr:hypothetical protein N752_19940 [Desulforamulus aquiferis]
MKAIEKGAPGDLIFQSLAGTQAANDAFGISVAILKEAREVGLRYGRATGLM